MDFLFEILKYGAFLLSVALLLFTVFIMRKRRQSQVAASDSHPFGASMSSRMPSIFLVALILGLFIMSDWIIRHSRDSAEETLRTLIDRHIMDSMLVYIDASNSVDQNATKKLTLRIETLERAFVTDPEAILSLTLLKKDYDYLKADVNSVKDMIKTQNALIQEAQAQSRWIIGTITVAVLGFLLAMYKMAFDRSPRLRETARGEPEVARQNGKPERVQGEEAPQS